MAHSGCQLAMAANTGSAIAGLTGKRSALAPMGFP
jgi:hypothetical protein